VAAPAWRIQAEPGPSRGPVYRCGCGGSRSPKLGYGRAVHGSLRAGGGAPAHLTLGGLHRSLLARIGQPHDAAISIHFEQRSSVAPSRGTPASNHRLFVTRGFDAQLGTRDGRVQSARLISTGMSGQPHECVWLARDGARYLYSTDGVRFGPLQTRPDLFDLARFERRLDEVTVTDVTIEQVPRDRDRSLMVLEADVAVDSFRRLLAVFASGGGDAADDLDLRSYSVALSSADDVALDYWWSLIGSEVPERDASAFRRSVACHVQVSVAPVVTSGEPPPIAVDSSLRTLRDIDEVWKWAHTQAAEAQTAASKPVRRSRRTKH